MGMFERLMGALNWLIVILLCLLTILMVGQPPWFETHRSGIVRFANDSKGQIGLVLIAVLISALNWLFVVKLVKKSKYQRSIRFQNPGGDVIVQLGAVEECLTRAARETDEVHDVKVRVFSGTKKKPVTVVASVALWDALNVPSVVEKLQERLKGRFMEILNIEESVDVEVTLRRIVTKGEARKRKQGDQLGPASDDGFRGPEYPID